MSETKKKKPWVKPVLRRITRDEALEIFARHPTAAVPDPIKNRLK
jgi:hypothetical protein